MSVAPAATVMLLRPEGPSFQVFMVQRHRKSGFMPNAWVFPGGRVDPGDAMAGHPAVRGGAATCARMGLPETEGVAWLVAAVRETFEESGLWLGDDAPPAVTRGPLARGERRLADVLAASGARIDLDRLTAWSRWVTPEVEPRRFDTWFLVARANGEGTHDAHETVDSGWFSPAELLEGAGAGRFPMAPPTWWTLRELAAHPTIEGVLHAATHRTLRPIQPILSIGEGDVRLVLPGHAGHPEPAIPGLPTEVRFVQGRWWADDVAAPEFLNASRTVTNVG